MAQLLFANQAPNAIKGELLCVLDDAHKFSRNEIMGEFINEGGRGADWSYMFSLVIITDKTGDELQYLLEEIYTEATDTAIKKYTFIEPAKGTPEYGLMRGDGQISITFSEFEQYMRLT